MNVLVLTCDFQPTASSVASCMKPLVISLGGNGHNVHVVTNNGVVNENNSVSLDGITIHRIVDAYTNKTCQIDASVRNTTANRYVQFLLRKIYKLPYYLRHCIFRKNQRIGGWSIKKTVEFCLALHEDQGFDVIISTSQPFTPHLMAMQIKKHLFAGIKWIAYEFDPYSYNATINQSKSNISRFRNQEMAVFALADTIILTPELFDFYKSKDLGAYADKMEPLPFVYPEFFEERNMKHEPHVFPTECLFVYAGEFYKDIRNPLFALQVFGSLNCSFKLLFLTNYQEKHFQRIVESSPTIFESMKQVSQKEAISWLIKADFLVSIGNTVEMQVPAKIFEYMSLGKPIIHFSKIPNDPAIHYFNQYPAILIIKEYEVKGEDPVKAIEEFVKKYKDISISDDEIRKCLANLDERVVVKQFLSIIEKND